MPALAAAAATGIASGAGAHVGQKVAEGVFGWLGDEPQLDEKSVDSIVDEKHDEVQQKEKRCEYI